MIALAAPGVAARSGWPVRLAGPAFRRPGSAWIASPSALESRPASPRQRSKKAPCHPRMPRDVACYHRETGGPSSPDGMPASVRMLRMPAIQKPHVAVRLQKFVRT